MFSTELRLFLIIIGSALLGVLIDRLWNTIFPSENERTSNHLPGLFVGVLALGITLTWLYTTESQPVEPPPIRVSTVVASGAETSNPNILFSEDFEGDVEEPFFDSLVKEEDGNHYYRIPAASFFEHQFGSLHWRDYRLTVRLRWIEFDCDEPRVYCTTLLIVRQQGQTPQQYSADITQGVGISITYEDGIQYSYLTNWHYFDLELGRWYVVDMIVDGDTISVDFANQPGIIATDSKLQQGSAGIRVHPGVTVDIDDIRVEKLND